MNESRTNSRPNSVNDSLPDSLPSRAPADQGTGNKGTGSRDNNTHPIHPTHLNAGNSTPTMDGRNPSTTTDPGDPSAPTGRAGGSACSGCRCLCHKTIGIEHPVPCCGATARGIWAEIGAERLRAHLKHGQTSMESMPVDDPFGARRDILIEELGEVSREYNEARHDGRLVDLVKVRCELIQLAAMAAAWADAIGVAEVSG